MVLENILRKTKNFGKGLIAITLLASSLSLGCQKSTGPDIKKPSEGPPKTPYISKIIPIADEPNRGMELYLVDMSNNEQGFNLERKEEGSDYIQIANLPSHNEAEMNYEDWNNIKTSTFYFYRIRAYNKFGSSNWSEISVKKSTELQENSLSARLEADAYVEIENPERNHGNEKWISVAGTLPQFNAMDYEEALVLFSLPNLPYYAQFKSAELGLCEAGGGNTHYPGLMGLAVGLLCDPWNENTVTFNNRPWSWLGTYSYGEHNPNNPEERCVNVDVTKTVLLLYNGTRPNYGFVILPTRDSSYCSYYSKEGYSPGAAHLTISYDW